MSVAPISVSCMQGDLVHMTATVPVARVQMDLTTADDPWTKDSVNNVYTKSWTATEFTSADMIVDGSDNLVLTKSVSAPCKDEQVDGIPVCLKTGHSLEFKCKYPLGTRIVKNDLNVSGHDANVDAEGVGELKYTLSVADGDVKIGEPVEVTITPANPNLVFAQLNDCNVEYESASVSILDYDKKWTILEDTDCMGNDLRYVNNIMSLESCLAECDKFADCDSITWTPVGPTAPNKCFIKNNFCEYETNISENPTRYNKYPGITSAKKNFKECESGWNMYTIDNTEICLKSVGKSRLDEATTICNRFNAKVPLPKNKQQDTDLYKSIQQLGLNSCALDGNDVASEGRWVDSSGNLLSYTNWKTSRPPIQPDNWGTGEDYLIYDNSQNGDWNDVAGSYQGNVVCMKSPRASAAKDQLAPVCEIGANIDTAYGKTDLTFDWKAFKWATATKDAVEQQTISCKITLSKDSPDFDVGSC